MQTSRLQKVFNLLCAVIAFLIICQPHTVFADHEFFYAINTGNEKQVENILKNNPNKDFGTDFMGSPPLQVAVQKGHLNITRMLIEAGENLKQAVSVDGVPLITLAIKSENVELIRYLLKSGCSANETDPLGVTPLHAAVIGYKPEIIRLLLAEGAKIDEREQLEGYTPLHFAAGNISRIEYFNYRGKDSQQKNLYEIAKLLIENGANPDSTAWNGKTPYLLAHKRARKEHRSKNSDARDIADYLKSLGVRTSTEKSFPMQILPLIKEGQQTAIANFLNRFPEAAKTRFERGLFKTTSYQPFGVVSYAAKTGNLPVLKLLISAGGDPLEKNPGQFDLKTPLHLAADNGHAEIVEYLLKKGVPANIKDSKGITPLHLASKNGFIEIIQTLRKNKASPHQKSRFGILPATWAINSSITAYIYLKFWMWQTLSTDANAATDFSLFDSYEIQMLIGNLLGKFWPILLPLVMFFIAWKVAGLAFVINFAKKIGNRLGFGRKNSSDSLVRKEIFFVFMPMVVGASMLLAVVLLTIMGLGLPGGHPPFIIFPLALNAVSAVIGYPLCILILTLGIGVLQSEFTRFKWVWLISFIVLITIEIISLSAFYFLR